MKRDIGSSYMRDKMEREMRESERVSKAMLEYYAKFKGIDERSEKRIKRAKEMMKLRLEGKSLQEIGLLYGVTRSRIQQILSRLPEYSKNRVYTKRVFLEKVCPACEGKFTTKREKQRCCSQRCSAAYRWAGEKKSPEEIAARKRVYASVYYHTKLKTNVDWKMRHKQAVKRYLDKKM